MSAPGLTSEHNAAQHMGVDMNHLLANKLLHAARVCMCAKCEMTFGSIWLLRHHLRKWHGAHVPGKHAKDSSELLLCPFNQCYTSLPESQLFEHFDAIHLVVIAQSCPISDCKDKDHVFPNNDQLYHHLKVVHCVDAGLQQIPGLSTSLCSTLPQLGQPLSLTLQPTTALHTRRMFPPVYAHPNLPSRHHSANARPADFNNLDLSHDSQSFIPSSISTPSTVGHPLDNSLPSPPAPSSQLGFLVIRGKPKSPDNQGLIPHIDIANMSVGVLDPEQPSIAAAGAIQECSAAGNELGSDSAEPEVDFDEEWAIQQWKRWQGNAKANDPLHDGATIDAVTAKLAQSHDVQMDIEAISVLMEAM